MDLRNDLSGAIFRSVGCRRRERRRLLRKSGAEIPPPPRRGDRTAARSNCGSPAVTGPLRARKAFRWTEVRRHSHFYLFISPFFILFAIFGLYPLLFSLYLSFVKWDGLTDQMWVGLGNFSSMLDDELLLKSLWNTLIIGALYIPPMFILAFLFAQALNL